MRLIDADALKIDFYDEYETEDDAYAYGYVSKHQIDMAPTIDAVSVIRCRECKHKYQEPWNNGVAVEGECEIWHNATLDNDYCSYGERGGRVNENH